MVMERVLPNPVFQWVNTPCGEALACAPLAAVASHLFTTRQLQLQGAADATAAQWDAIGRTLGVSSPAIVRLQQVHGASVAVLRAGAPIPEGAPPIRSDAVVTDDSRVAISVAVADCVPILVADRRSGAVAAVHAGWRGTCASIAAAAVRVLQEQFDVAPSDLVAAIGPSIGPCCYEVGRDVRDAFEGNGFAPDLVERWFTNAAQAGGRLHLDLWSANRDQLVAAGVPAGQVHLSGLCTFTNTDAFFSYRREGDTAGRMAAVIRVKP